MSAAPILETERLVLRLPTMDDYAASAAFLATDRTRYMGGVRTPREAWRSFAAMAGHWALRGYGFFTVCRKGEAAGCAAVGPHRPEYYPDVEIGWVIWDEALEGQGIAFEAVTAARDWARAHFGPEQSFVSFIDPANARSIRLAERLGAVPDPDHNHPFGEEPCVTYRHPEVMQ